MPDNSDDGRFTLRDARFNFRNFSGTNSRFYVPGTEIKRNFGCVLPLELALQMRDDGWPVKFPDPRVEDDEPDPYIVVHLGYKIRPPRVAMQTTTGVVALGTNKDDLSDLDVLDWADIKTAHVIANMGHWTMETTGKTGNKAWLKTLVVVIEEDELELEFGLNAPHRSTELPTDLAELAEAAKSVG